MFCRRPSPAPPPLNPRPCRPPQRFLLAPRALPAQGPAARPQPPPQRGPARPGPRAAAAAAGARQGGAAGAVPSSPRSGPPSAGAVPASQPRAGAPPPPASGPHLRRRRWGPDPPGSRGLRGPGPRARCEGGPAPTEERDGARRIVLGSRNPARPRLHPAAPSGPQVTKAGALPRGEPRTRRDRGGPGRSGAPRAPTAAAERPQGP